MTEQSTSPLPPGWAMCTLGELGNYYNGRGFKKSEWRKPGQGRPIIRIQDLTGSNSNPNYFDGEVDDRNVARPGDLLVSWAATLGVFVWGGPEGVINQHIFKVDSFVNASWHRYLIESVLEDLRRESHGSGMVHVTRGAFDAIRVKLPPLAEQERIVAAIEEQFSRLVAGVTALGRVRQNVKRLRAALLKVAVSGSLVEQLASEGTGFDLLAETLRNRGGGKPPKEKSADLAVPSTWAVASLDALTDPQRVTCYGILMPKVSEGGVIPYVEVKDLRTATLDVTRLHRTTKELHAEFSRSELKAGDVVLAIRGSYDRCLVVPPNCAGANVSRDVARIAPLSGLDSNFLAAYLKSPIALRYLRERARGVAVKGINIADLRTMPIPLPPLEEQRRISEALEEALSILDALEKVLDAGDQRSVALRSAVLTSAFSGALVAQDPTDEPADFLLKRIASEPPLRKSKSSKRNTSKETVVSR